MSPSILFFHFSFNYEFTFKNNLVYTHLVVNHYKFPSNIIAEYIICDYNFQNREIAKSIIWELMKILLVKRFKFRENKWINYLLKFIKVKVFASNKYWAFDTLLSVLWLYYLWRFRSSWTVLTELLRYLVLGIQQCKGPVLKEISGGFWRKISHFLQKGFCVSPQSWTGETLSLEIW